MTNVVNLNQATEIKLARHLAKLVIFTSEKLGQAQGQSQVFRGVIEGEVLKAWKAQKDPGQRDVLWGILKQLREWGSTPPA
jgi:hypothetical protein